MILCVRYFERRLALSQHSDRRADFVHLDFVANPPPRVVTKETSLSTLCSSSLRVFWKMKTRVTKKGTITDDGLQGMCPEIRDGRIDHTRVYCSSWDLIA